jgi:glycosyltransferase involved in cell wall biosynthesis
MAAEATIVITCFNQSSFLADSILSAQAQSVPVSIVVVDDGSSDDTMTMTVCRRFSSVRYLHQRNQGLAAARNTGLRAASTEYVTFLDADDRLLPHAVETGVTRLSVRPRAVMSSGDHRYIDTSGRLVSEWQRIMPDRDHYEALLRGNFIGMGGAVVFRRQVVVAVGGFDKALGACEDYDLYLRLAREHEVDAHSMLVAEYRRHEHNMSHDPFLMLESALRVLVKQYRYREETARWSQEAWLTGLQYWLSYYGPAIAVESRRLSPQSWARAARLLAITATQHVGSAVRLLGLLLTSKKATAA